MTPASIAEREWRRFTPAERLSRFAVYFMIVAAVVVSIRTVEVIPEFVADAPEQIADLLRRMWPPDLAYYPQEVNSALIDSMHIATVGTVLGRRRRAASLFGIRRCGAGRRFYCSSVETSRALSGQLRRARKR